MIVCVCRNVSDRKIRSSLLGGAQSVRQLRDELGVTGCCGKCGPRVRELVSEHGAARAAVDALTADCAPIMEKVAVRTRRPVPVAAPATECV